MRYTLLSFPEIQLPTRAAHQLRGYFGNLFKERSPLLHNHYADGQPMYRYPLVQYKVLRGVPTLLGLREGAALLMELFLKVECLEIHGQHYTVEHKALRHDEIPIGHCDQLLEYRFETHCLMLNQKNYQDYLKTTDDERATFLNKKLTNHLLSLLKGLDVWLEPHQRILTKAQLQERNVQFKNQKMIGFSGQFITNLMLPPHVGIGKSVARGFGSVIAV